MLIALEELTSENGLFSWNNGPEKISKGEWATFLGDEVVELVTTCGGTSILLDLGMKDM